MSARAGLRVTVAVAAAVALAGAFSLYRPGYSPDEEFTLFAVRGIDRGGLPRLPSGLVYDRGLLFSYGSWLLSAATGIELPAFRLLALLCGVGSLFVGFAVTSHAGSAAAGAAAVGLVAASLPFWAAATTGRFYAPFVFAAAAVLAVSARLRVSDAGLAPRFWPLLGIAGLGAVARLTHELAFTLVAVPAAGFAMDRLARADSSSSLARPRRKSGRTWLLIALALCAGLAAAQAMLIALHFAVPHGDGGGDTMIRRFFLWQLLNLFEVPRGAPAGVIATLIVLAWVLAPATAATALTLGGLSVGVVLAAAVTHAAATSPEASVAVPRVLADSLDYPLDMFWHLAGHYPAMVLAALGLLVLRLCGAGGEWPPRERAAHLAWLGWVLWFGAIESGVTINYVLLPTVCMLTAIGLDLVAVAQHTRALWPGPRAQVARAALSGVALVVIADGWGGGGAPLAQLAEVRPTIRMDGLEQVVETLQPRDLVACTDELACLLLVGRVDVWLTLDEFLRERFIVRRAGQDVGVYAGAPAAARLDELLERGAARGGRIVIVDVFKNYPVGNSREWLPRALAAEGLTARPLLATAQGRVVEIATDGRSRPRS